MEKEEKKNQLFTAIFMHIKSGYINIKEEFGKW